MKDFFRKDPKRTGLVVGLVTGLLVGLVVVASFIIWDLGYECVRWSTHVERRDLADHPVRICVEYRPRWGENVGK